MSSSEDFKNQLSFDPGKDKAYRVLFDTLNDLPDDQLPDGFSEKVLKSLQKKQSRSSKGYFMVMVLGVFTIVASILGGALYFFGTETFNVLRDFSSWGVLIGILVALIQYFDSKLLRKRIKLI